jgi:hypothetical protein
MPWYGTEDHRRDKFVKVKLINGDGDACENCGRHIKSGEQCIVQVEYGTWDAYRRNWNESIIHNGALHMFCKRYKHVQESCERQ